MTNSARKKQIKITSNGRDEMNLALKALNVPSRRAEFLFNPAKYAKKENLHLDPEWVKVIEEEVDKINRQLIRIEGKFDRKP